MRPAPDYHFELLVAARIHEDLQAAMKFARVWGTGVFDGQTVHRTHVLSDGDIVEVHE